MAFSQFNDNNFKKGNTISFSNKKKHDLTNIIFPYVFKRFI